MSEVPSEVIARAFASKAGLDAVIKLAEATTTPERISAEVRQRMMADKAAVHKQCLEFAYTALSALTAAGWTVAPMEATPAMIDAGLNAPSDGYERVMLWESRISRIWTAMLTASKPKDKADV